MKVEVRPGYWLTKDHPHEIRSPHVMRFEEIRDWLRTLSTDERYGWVPGGVRGLERALGMQPDGIDYKLNHVGWIWPKEQVRLTARIEDILAGHIVPRRLRTGFANNTTIQGVMTDPPEPPQVPTPRTIKLRATVNGLERQPPHYSNPPHMPNFRVAFESVAFWNPETNNYGKKAACPESSESGAVVHTVHSRMPRVSARAAARKGLSSKNSARR